MKGHRQFSAQLAAMLALFVITAIACNLGAVPETPTPRVSPTSSVKPSVIIQSPANNSNVAAGQPITVQASSSHPDGVTRLELRANNQQVDTKVSQNPLGDQQFGANLTYTPALSGALVLTVIAYRNNLPSDPASITVNVQTAQPTTAPDDTSNQPYDPTCRARVDVNGLNFRQGPGQSFPPYQVLPLGTVVLITGRIADNSWWQGRISNTVGWMSASFVTLLGICNNIAVVQSPATPTVAATITLTPAATVAQASSTSAKPDVVVIDISGPVSIILDQNSTKTATYRVTVQNSGSVATGQFNVGLVLPDGSLSDLGAVPALQPGQAAIFTATVNFTAPGSARLTAIADKDNVVDESNENNNLKSLDVVLIKPTPLPATTAAPVATTPVS